MFGASSAYSLLPPTPLAREIPFICPHFWREGGGPRAGGGWMRIFPIRAARPPRSPARSFVRVFFWGEEGAGREGPLHHPGNPKGKSAKLEMSEARRRPGRATDALTGGRILHSRTQRGFVCKFQCTSIRTSNFTTSATSYALPSAPQWHS